MTHFIINKINTPILKPDLSRQCLIINCTVEGDSGNNKAKINLF